MLALWCFATGIVGCSDAPPWTGFGAAPRIQVAQTWLSFGQVAVGGEVVRELIVRNVGNRPLVLSPGLRGDTELGIASISGPIAPGAMGVVGVRCRPTYVNGFGAVLVLNNNGPAGTHPGSQWAPQIDLACEGVLGQPPDPPWKGGGEEILPVEPWALE